MLDALASTGSGTILDKPGEAKGQWIFDTPRGEFTVQSKLINPVWVKPDWAFIEEGLAVPRSQADRIEPGVLGEYAARIRQRVLHPRHSLHATPGQERDPWLYQTQRRGSQERLPTGQGRYPDHDFLTSYGKTFSTPRAGHQGSPMISSAGCSKRPSSKAAASEEIHRTASAGTQPACTFFSPLRSYFCPSLWPAGPRSWMSFLVSIPMMPARSKRRSGSSTKRSNWPLDLKPMSSSILSNGPS